VIGRGNSTLEDSLEAAATRQGRVVVSESQPERGMFYRSDHFEFAKVGIPALYFKSGLDYIGKPKEFGKQKIDEFIARDYHRVTEEIRPDWDLSGAVEDARLMFDVGWNVAQERRRPEWKRGSEFKREAVTSGVTGK
jgi:Zn-dependent M28 family amino/carboxypeptidase